MTTVAEKNCSLLLCHETSGVSSEANLQKELESKDERVKIEALKKIILLTLNGESFPKLLMSVIKFCLHTENHAIKKLLLLYWEVVEKKNPDGTLLHEMILVCNAMKNNLSHPNEYIRGATLKFLCKMKEDQILESLIPSVTANLEHRHSYVRKNACLTVYTIYEAFPDLIPDAPELIETLLNAESNPQAKRNAFLMLNNCDTARAVNYLGTVASSISTQGESFQLVCLELIRKVCRADPLVKSQYIQVIFTLVNSKSNAVAFEGANTLVALSSAPTAVRAAISAYCTLLQAESDNNIKLIILQRLSGLKRRNEKIMQEMLMDILRTLDSPNIDIRRKTLELTLDLVSRRNVEQVVQLLKKEIVKSSDASAGKAGEGYRKLLVDAMHQCAVKFPDVVQNVVHLLMNYLGDESDASAVDVVYFVREIVEEYPDLRDGILAKLMENFEEIKASSVFRVALWIMGEYCVTESILDLALQTIRSAIGELPLLEAPVVEVKAEAKPEKPKTTTKAVVLADGTYAQQSHVEPTTTVVVPSVNMSTLRKLLVVERDFFLATAVGNTLTKLTLRFGRANTFGSAEVNEEIAKSLSTITSMLRLGTTEAKVDPSAPAPKEESKEKGRDKGGSSVRSKLIDPDSHSRLLTCLRVLLDPETWVEVFMLDSRKTFAEMLKAQRQNSKKEEKAPELLAQVDSLINIRHLKNRGQVDMDFVDDDEADLSRAVGAGVIKQESKLNRVYQLTGCADPVYSEAVFTVLDYNIVLELLVVNQTNATLQNLQIELNTSGDLKLVERPTTHTIKPFGAIKVSANVKVTSTESGVIFGNIVYDSASGANQTVVVMNSIHLDIMDYISPNTCTDTAFRAMWAEFEWENKVAVNTEITDLNEYLEHVISITNMGNMTPQASMTGSCNFLAANLYATSLFGEDALLNLSVEKQTTPAEKISGFIRIRSKTQGIALSLGDNITSKQRNKKLVKKTEE